jgi:hypothetical protein
MLYEKTGALFISVVLYVPSVLPNQAQMYNDLINWSYFQQIKYNRRIDVSINVNIK